MTAIKCVVWDLDGTVWDGMAIEAPPGTVLEPFPDVLRAMEVLEERGIVNSLASRTDPMVGDLVRDHPRLARRFVYPQFGWADKSCAIRRIADELGMQVDALAFVDDSPFERANVAAVLPEVVVLEPAQLLGLLDSPLFRPAAATAEARGRADRYREEQLRRQAQGTFAGSRDEFFAWCRMRLSVGPATPADADRLAELSVRTHRFNSSGEALSPERAGLLVNDPGWFVPVARLTDRFGDYGLVGAAFVGRDQAASGGTCRLRLLTTSCRVAGRGVAATFLLWIMGTVRAAGTTRLLAEVRHTEANLDLRVLFRQAGFRAVAGGTSGDVAGTECAETAHVLLGRALTKPLPAYPPWVHLVETR